MQASIANYQQHHYSCNINYGAGVDKVEKIVNAAGRGLCSDEDDASTNRIEDGGGALNLRGNTEDVERLNDSSLGETVQVITSSAAPVPEGNLQEIKYHHPSSQAMIDTFHNGSHHHHDHHHHQPHQQQQQQRSHEYNQQQVTGSISYPEAPPSNELQYAAPACYSAEQWQQQQQQQLLQVAMDANPNQTVEVFHNHNHNHNNQQQHYLTTTTSGQVDCPSFYQHLYPLTHSSLQSSYETSLVSGQAIDLSHQEEEEGVRGGEATQVESAGAPATCDLSRPLAIEEATEEEDGAKEEEGEEVEEVHEGESTVAVPVISINTCYNLTSASVASDEAEADGESAYATIDRFYRLQPQNQAEQQQQSAEQQSATQEPLGLFAADLFDNNNNNNSNNNNNTEGDVHTLDQLHHHPAPVVSDVSMIEAVRHQQHHLDLQPLGGCISQSMLSEHNRFASHQGEQHDDTYNLYPLHHHHHHHHQIYEHEDQMIYVQQAHQYHSHNHHPYTTSQHHHHHHHQQPYASAYECYREKDYEATRQLGDQVDPDVMHYQSTMTHSQRHSGNDTDGSQQQQQQQQQPPQLQDSDENHVHQVYRASDQCQLVNPGHEQQQPHNVECHQEVSHDIQRKTTILGRAQQQQQQQQQQQSQSQPFMMVGSKTDTPSCASSSFGGNRSHSSALSTENDEHSTDDDDDDDLESVDSQLTRDERRAREANIPLSYHEIVNLSIDQFNDHIMRFPFSEAQLTLMKDIRRRGKNKVAAQTCRKRKMEQISELQLEVAQLANKRMLLSCERERLIREHARLTREYERLRNAGLENHHLQVARQEQTQHHHHHHHHDLNDHNHHLAANDHHDCLARDEPNDLLVNVSS